MARYSLFVLKVPLNPKQTNQPCVRVKIEDAEEEKSSVHLRDVIKSGEAVTTIGFGDGESAAASSVVNILSALPDM